LLNELLMNFIKAVYAKQLLNPSHYKLLYFLTDTMST